jgi:phosphatidylserine/phosphatidylglycerophosphate/cardiolipin synthase-like enzyme
MFTFARSSGIDDTMIRLVGSLQRLRGVLDRVQGGQAWAATGPLKAAGLELYQNKPGTGVRKVHHTLMVIDERLVIAGSFTYAAPATTLNDENIIVLGDLEETNPGRRSRPTRPRRLRPGLDRPHRHRPRRTCLNGQAANEAAVSVRGGTAL